MGFLKRIKRGSTGLDAERRKFLSFKPSIRNKRAPFVATSELREFTNDAGNESKTSKSSFGQQEQEIENIRPNVRTNIEDESLTITSQSAQIKELTELKRVTELGTSAKTIDMMAEYTEKMTETEEIKRESKKEAENQTRLDEEAIAAKDRETVVVREDLPESRNCNEEIRRDNEALRDAMAGLSATYHTDSGNNAGGETAAEDEGYMGHSSGNNSEIQFLRDENARLREEGMAAKEWISTAASKMEVMRGEIDSLAQSLEDALAKLASTGSSNSDSLSIQHHMELQSVREEYEAKLKTKDDAIATWQAHVQQLEDRIDGINLCIKTNDKTSSQKFEELQQVIARQEAELESLLQVTVTSERNKSLKNQPKITLEMGELRTENADLLKRIGDNQAQELSEKEAITAELNRVKLENETLEACLNHIQSWSEAAQSHLAEVEAKLKEATSERDDLMTREKSSASRVNEASSQDYSQLLESLQKELDEKNEQLERMQYQLIEDADENEAKKNQLLDDCEAEKQRAEGLSHEKSSLSATVVTLSFEKEHLTSTLSEKQSLIDSTNASNDDAGMRVEEAQRRISDLEAALCASESQVHNVMALKEQIVSVAAERDDLQSQLNHITDDTEKKKLLEHDNISLQNQISELEREITTKDNEKSTLQNELGRFKTVTEECVQVWQELTQSLATGVSSLENQLAQQEYEAAVAIAQWESMYSTLEETGGHNIRQLEERVQSLESDITSLEHRLEQQVREAAEAITCWKARFSALGESEGVVIRQCEERLQLLESNVTALENLLHQKEKEAMESHAKFSEAVRSLTTTNDELKIISQQILALDSTVAMMTSQIVVLRKQNEEKSESIECMKLQTHNKDASLAKSNEQLSKLSDKLLETQQQSELVVKQWQDRSEQLEANINEFEHTLEEVKISSEDKISLQNQLSELVRKITTKDNEKSTLQNELDRVTEESVQLGPAQIICSENVKAERNEIEQIRTIRTTIERFSEERESCRWNYTASPQAGIHLMRSGSSLSSFPLLSYSKSSVVEGLALKGSSDGVVRVVSSVVVDDPSVGGSFGGGDFSEMRFNRDDRMCSVNSRTMSIAAFPAALLSRDDVSTAVTAENLLSSSQAANTRLQMSILKQVTTPAKNDFELVEQALEDLETSKIIMSVSHEHRIEVFQNERLWAGLSHEEEMHGVEVELVESNEERDSLAHKLEPIEKANAALVYSTAHNDPGEEESESSQLLVKISEMGAWSCLGLGSRRHYIDWVDDKTSVCDNQSKRLGETTHPSSFESSCSSYDDDDEGSGESSQPAVSRVNQVLILSLMADDISDISLSSSSDSDDNDGRDDEREKTEPSVFVSSCSSYDDDYKGSEESSQPVVSPVHQVLIMSMATDLSEIYPSFSDD
jgi:chromosome segregation ATPase